MKNFIILVLAILLLGSCSPQRRLNRLIRNHQELSQLDTITITDTTILPEIRIDTVVHHSTLKDTLIITKEKLKLQLIEINDTIYIEAYHEPDTVVFTKEIPVERIIYKETESKLKTALLKFKYYLLFVVGFIVLVIILRFFLKKQNNY